MQLLTPASPSAVRARTRAGAGWLRPARPADRDGAFAPPVNITSFAYIQQSFRAAPADDRTDLYRNSYRILKKIYNSNKTFETSLTTIRRSRYDLDKITQTAPASRNLFISQSHDRA